MSAADEQGAHVEELEAGRRTSFDARQLARDLALLFCGATAAYLIATIVAGQLALFALGQAHRLGSSVWALVAGAALLDLGKLLGLLPVAWIVCCAVTFRPSVAASLLVLLCFGLELLVMLLLQAAAWSWERPEIWGTRLVVAAILILPVSWVMARGRAVSAR